MQQQVRWAVVMTALVMTWVVCSPATAAAPYMSEMIKKPAYARTLKILLDHAGKLPNWTREVLKPKGANVESPATHATIDGITYDVFFNCESQNCNQSQLAVMFAPDGTQAWGALFQEGKISYLGAPSEVQQAVLRGTLGDRTGK